MKWNISSQAHQMYASLILLFIPTCIHRRPPVLAERFLGTPPNYCGSNWMRASAVCGSMTGRSGHWEKMRNYQMIDRESRKSLNTSPPRISVALKPEREVLLTRAHQNCVCPTILKGCDFQLCKCICFFPPYCQGTGVSLPFICVTTGARR